jgi:hypothetical protein
MPNHNLRWWVTKGLQDELYVYCHYNTQLSLLSAHRFDLLGPSPSFTPTDTQQAISKKLADLLTNLHVYRARGAPDDLMNAMQTVRRALKVPGLSPLARQQLYCDFCVILQDLSTVLFLQGRTERARQIDKTAAQYYEKSIANITDRHPYFATRTFRLQTRQVAILGYSEPSLTVAVERQDLDLAAKLALDSADYELLLVLATLEINGQTNKKLRSELLSVFDQVLQCCGYGQDFDLLLGITIRYRWWILLLLDSGLRTVRLDLLARDLQFWLDRQCFSTIRAFLRMLLQLEQNSDRRREAVTLQKFIQRTVVSHPNSRHLVWREV